MTHDDHVALIKDGIKPGVGGMWADIGSGEGSFTLALRELAGEKVIIYSVDKDKGKLAKQAKIFNDWFPTTDIQYIVRDFTEALDLPKLDGVIAANAIHFQQDTVKTLQHIQQYLKPGGRLIIVEYNVDEGNMWVPYPFSFETFKKLAMKANLYPPSLLGTVPSQNLNEMYAAIAFNAAA